MYKVIFLVRDFNTAETDFYDGVRSLIRVVNLLQIGISRYPYWVLI